MVRLENPTRNRQISSTHKFCGAFSVWVPRKSYKLKKFPEARNKWFIVQSPWKIAENSSVLFCFSEPCLDGRSPTTFVFSLMSKDDSYSPTGVLEDFLRTADSETVSSKASTSELEVQRSSKLISKWRGVIQLLKSRSRRPLNTLHPLKLSRRMSSSLREYMTKGATNPLMVSDLGYLKPQWRNFTLSELQTASNCFSRENLIGKGGYAEVYKGRLRDGQLVAIKRLTRGLPEDFLLELGIMAHVDHPNTTKLIGYGVDGGMHLVLEFSPLGSLTSLLHHGSKQKLNWDIRYKVALGTAEGLLYLHEGCRRRIIHRDIKAANILLTENFEPQICDFGLAKWLPEQWTHHTVSKFQGTLGYLAPEYLMHGIVDEKTDVFAFGVLLLELITGRRALDYSKQSLVVWAKPLLRRNKIRELIDPSLGDDYNSTQIKLMVVAAFLCIQQSSIQRPEMRQIVHLLKGSQGSLELMKKYQKPSFWKRYYVELFTADGARELNSLKEQKQLALEA